MGLAAVALGAPTLGLPVCAVAGLAGIDCLCCRFCKPGPGRISASCGNALFRRMAVLCELLGQGSWGSHSAELGPVASEMASICPCTGSCLNSGPREISAKTALSTQTRKTLPATLVTATISPEHVNQSRATSMDQARSSGPKAFIDSHEKAGPSDRARRAFQIPVCAFSIV